MYALVDPQDGFDTGTVESWLRRTTFPMSASTARRRKVFGENLETKAAW